MTSHDVMKHADIIGGQDAYADKLNEAFTNAEPSRFIAGYGSGYISYSNQPGVVAGHCFNYVGKPWLSQKWVRRVKELSYALTDPTQNGGWADHDEDQGQMGGVSALMGIGLFSVRGGSGIHPIFEITSPIFDTVTITLDNKYYPGKEFVIIAHNNSEDNMYIQSAKLNGKDLKNAWFFHQDYIKGGRLELWMGPAPNESWGIEQLPQSESRPLLEPVSVEKRNNNSRASHSSVYKMVDGQFSIPPEWRGKEAVISVFDQKGRIMWRGSVTENAVNLKKTPAMNQGLYIVKIESAELM
jgi:putative alpha-1,2-mannosidase